MKLICMLTVTILIFALGIQSSLSEEKPTQGLDATTIMSKLDAALTNQAEILKQLEQIKQELAIIKVRCSR